MATTGFWPVKNRLKEVIDYARNPDKTTDKKFLDEDLWAALRYVENDKKTDQTMYVSGINCPKQRAYEYMMATKQRYGKLGGNIAYHGYQSFVSGEVTPEEAHAIGLETAKRMWGENYEIVVTTHLNTDNIHNHFVINSVSFRTGRKFENHISDHYKLREISDEICRERGKSVLAPSKFTGSRKKDYWIHKSGGLTHRNMLKRDIDEALSKTTNGKAFELFSKSKKDTTIAKQLLRSATSIGANINEAVYGNSKADFISKLHISLKETGESIYWLTLLKRTNLIEYDFESLLALAEEIKRMLIASLNTAKENIK